MELESMFDLEKGYVSSKATRVAPNCGLWRKGKHWFRMWTTFFVIDTKYIMIKAIVGREYSWVCSAINRQTNEAVSIKKISDLFENKTDALRTLGELRLPKHRNVISIKDVMMPTDPQSFHDVYVVYESFQTNLQQIIRSPALLITNDHCRYLLFQILKGLKHLHSAGIVVRDLEPEYLVVNTDNRELKICYFGHETNIFREIDGKLIMKKYDTTSTWYLAPEQLIPCDNDGTSIDIWSAGCILAEILGGRPFFRGANNLNQLKVILDILGRQQEDDLEFVSKPAGKRLIRSLNRSGMSVPFSSMLPPTCDPLALDLMSKMLVFHPSKRITVADALSHPYFSPLNQQSNTDDSPQAEHRLDTNIDETAEESSLRDLMLKEILVYHPKAFLC